MPRIDSISGVAPGGHSSTAARSSAALNEPLRRLPAIPTIRIALLLAFSFAFPFHHLVNDLGEAQGAGSRVLPVGVHEIELADALGAFAQRQRLEPADSSPPRMRSSGYQPTPKPIPAAHIAL